MTIYELTPCEAWEKDPCHPKQCATCGFTEREHLAPECVACPNSAEWHARALHAIRSGPSTRAADEEARFLSVHRDPRA